MENSSSSQFGFHEMKWSKTTPNLEQSTGGGIQVVSHTNITTKNWSLIKVLRNFSRHRVTEPLWEHLTGKSFENQLILDRNLEFNLTPFQLTNYNI